MSSRISKTAHTAMVTSLASLAAPIGTLLTGPLLARALGPDGRGHVAALLAPLALANLIFPFGLPDSLTYFCVVGKLTKAQALAVAIWGGSICSLVAVAASAICTPILFRREAGYIPEFYWLLIALPPALLFSGLRGIVQSSTEGFSLSNIEKALGAAGRLIALLVLFAFGRLTPLSAVWTTTLMQLAAAAVLLVDFRRLTQFSFSGLPLRQVFAYAGVAGAGTLAALVVIRLDQSLMVLLTTPAELAFYAVAVSLAELPLTAVGALRDVSFTASALRNDPAVTARFSRVTLAAVGILCAAEAVLAPFVLPLLFGRAFRPAVLMAEVLLLATMGRAVTTILGSGLMTAGRAWVRSLIQFAGAGLTTILLFVMVPAWGGLGAAWVTTLTYFLLAGLMTFSFTRAANISIAQCLLPTKEDGRKLAEFACGQRDAWMKR